MANAILSGCDAFGLDFSAAQLLATSYNSTSSGGSTGPPAGTHMSFLGCYPSVMNAGQLASFVDNGVSVFFFYENSGAGSIQPSFAGSVAAALANMTYAQGQADVRAIQAAMHNIGVSDYLNQPIYLTLDFDWNGSQGTFNTNALNYFMGAIDQLSGGTHHTTLLGLYGNGYSIQSINHSLIDGGYSYIYYFCQSRSTGWSGNGTYLDSSVTLGQNQQLWQWPPAYSPGGNVVIGTESVDGEFAYSNDFGQYPRSIPSEGVLSYASSVSNPTVSFTQPELQTLIVPKYSYDKIVYSDTLTASITTSSGEYLYGPISTGLTDNNLGAYPVGNFSIDGGVTFNDYGFIYSGDFGTYWFPNTPVNWTHQQWVVQPYTNNNGDLYFTITYPNGGTASANFIFNIAIIAGDNLTTISDTSITQSTAFSNIIPGAPTPYATYRRINHDGSAGAGYSIYTHELGTIPNLIFWQATTGNNLVVAPSTWASNTSSARNQSNLGIAMDSTNVYLFGDSQTSEVNYRIYLDN